MTSATVASLGPLLPVPRPTELDLLACSLLGPDRPRRRLPLAPADGVRGALERAMLGPLQRPPCLVSFSGGRDSSAVLAVAVHTARRHGLEDPIPVTMRFPDAPETDEREWQQLVVDHLGVRRHEVLELYDELDSLGAHALDTLRRHGVLWPPNAHMHHAIFELARGGSVLTGVGGDEVLGTSGGRLTLVARRRLRPRPGDLRLFATAALPRRLRATVVRRREDPTGDMPWLTPAGADRLGRALALDEVGWPDRWDGTIRHWHASRSWAAVVGTLPLLAEPYDVLVVNPLAQAEVLAAMAAEAGPVGWRGRHNAMHRLFRDVLPDELLARPDKAGFTRPVWGPHVRAFARDWDGTGVDAELVDVERLRAVWLSERPDFRTGMLLHAAALAAGPADVQDSRRSS